MENKIRLKFATVQWKNGVRSEVTLSGTVMDRYRDVVTVEQPMPSGKGGRIDLEHFKITADFYLVLADDLTTHKIRCRDVVIEPNPKNYGNKI
jgi:hypothetical protein